MWDYEASQKNDILLANSSTTQKRLLKYYRRKSTILYPPIETARFAKKLNSLLNPLPFQGKGTTRPKIYLVDNHNHVFYFWYLARSQGIISDNTLLYHIDEHADTRDPGGYLLKPDSQDLQKVFDYTNFTLNVGNYIIPAEKEGLI